MRRTQGQLDSRDGPCPHVGIVILNWQCVDDTLACLESLTGLDYPSYEVVVVNNGSSDGSMRIIQEKFADVAVIENGRNLGFAGGNNVGIAYSLDRGVDYILLLNSDTEVSRDLVRGLVDIAETDTCIGILGPKIYYHEPRNVIWSAGGTITAFGESGHFRIDETEDGSPETIRDVDYVTGCAILVRKQVVDVIGPLDERFFIYFEEAEWCVRARRAGFRVVYVPHARMWHKISVAARMHSPRYLYFMARNRLLYLHCAGAKRWVIMLALVDLLRTAASWWLRPQHREMRSLSGAVVRGVGDYVRGRFGDRFGGAREAR